MAVKLSDEIINRIRRNVMNGASRKDNALTISYLNEKHTNKTMRRR